MKQIIGLLMLLSILSIPAAGEDYTGCFMERTPNGIREQKEAVGKKNYLQSLDLAELEKKLKSADYQERLLAHVLVSQKTHGEKQIPVGNPGENDWGPVIEKLIVDFIITTNPESSLNMAQIIAEIYINATGERFVWYLENNDLSKYPDPDLRGNLIRIMVRMAEKKPELIPRVKKLLNRYLNDKDEGVRHSCEYYLKELSKQSGNAK